MKVVLIVGAPRSGTSLLRNLLTEALPNAVSLAEINEKWKEAAAAGSFDELASSDVDPERAAALREWFEQYVKRSGGKVLIEKTTANMLRLPLLKAVFPNAIYINITRDGRDVAASIRRQMSGDRRKITSGKRTHESLVDKLRSIRSTARAKMTAGLGLREMVVGYRRYLDGLLGTLGWKTTFFGPRYFGFQDDFRYCSLLEVGGRQWRSCVIAARNFFAANPELNVVSVRFEELLNSPQDVLQQIALRAPELEMSLSATELERIETWRTSLAKSELAMLAEIMEYELTVMGYPSTFPNTVGRRGIDGTES